jgi:hypothetical protein
MEMLNMIKNTNATSSLTSKVEAALTGATMQTNLDNAAGFYSIEGMSGKKYRYFINTLVGSIADARYLEVGSWAGSTLCSAIHNNKVTAVAIDNWSEFGGPKKIFMENVQRFTTGEAKVWFYESDFRKVDYAGMSTKFNIYLFDGPHEEKDQYDGLAMALPCMEKQFVFIVDDWNWERVRAGTFAAIQKCNLNVLLSTEVRTTLNNTHPSTSGKQSDWHNGYFISVLEKP